MLARRIPPNAENPFGVGHRNPLDGRWTGCRRSGFIPNAHRPHGPGVVGWGGLQPYGTWVIRWGVDAVYSVNALTVSYLQMYRRKVAGRRGGSGLQLHQDNRLEAVASAVNHITGRSSFIPRRGGR